MASRTERSDGKKRFPELDALRGFAAIFVFAFHSSLYLKTASPVFRFGITGVDLFFIISGFVIMLSISKTEHGYQFVINRISRLFPVYWAAVTFTLIAIFLTHSYLHDFPADPDWKQYFANLTMLQHYLGFEHLDGPYWTLTVELLFYVFMLFLFMLKALRSVVLISFLIVAYTVLLTYKYWNSEYYQGFTNQFPLAQYFPLFLAGILFLKLFSQKQKIRYYSLLIAGCYVAAVLLAKYSGKVPTYISLTEYAVTLAFYFVLFFLFVYGKLKFIVNKVTVFLGQISYALYLIHQFLIAGILIPVFMALGVNCYVAVFALSLPITILIATVITYTIEKPGGMRMKVALTNLFERRILPLYYQLIEKLRIFFRF